MPLPEEKNQTRLDNIVYSEPSVALKPKPKRGWIKIVLKTAVIILVLATAGLAVSVNLPAPDQVSNKPDSQKAGAFSWFSNFSIFSQLRQLAQSSDQKLKGEESDRVNILLLGVGGKGHDGAFLTDTIILASLKPSTRQVAMVSIPRDLSVPLEDMGWRKINNINAFAERANPGSGGQAVSQAVSHLFNIPVDYYLTVDFTGFAKIIDELGGIRVFVDNTLDDYAYPIMGKEDDPNYNARWEHLHIDAGWQDMNGDLALKFARSRHGVGAEGSDFARAHRQQKILEAVKDKILSINVLFKPRMISQLIDAYREHLSTNFSVWEMVKLWSMFKDVKQEQIINKVLDNSPSGLLVDKIGEDGAYTLIPKSGDFSQIEYLIKNIFAGAPQEEKTKIVKESASIEVLNGTWINGLANRLATDLEKYGFEVVFVGNASQRNFQKSVIYDLTAGAKTESLAMLKEKTGANVAYGLPDWLKNDVAKSSSTGKQNNRPDFILVLGEDANVQN